MLDDLTFTVTPKVGIAELARFETGVFRDGTRQSAFVERDACEDADLQFLAEREKSLFRRLIEYVVDHLYCGNGFGPDGFECGIGVMLGD